MSMEEKGNHQNLGTPTFCRNGCGFYAAQAFDGMCSKCYKDVKQQLQQPGGPVVQTSPSQTPLTPPGGPQVDDVDAVAVALSRTSLGGKFLYLLGSEWLSSKLYGFADLQ